MFRFEDESFRTTIGTIDFAFDVEYDIVSDETGTEYDWYPDGDVSVTIYDEDGNIVSEKDLEPSDPLVQEIFKHYNRQIVEQCHDDYSSAW